MSASPTPFSEWLTAEMARRGYNTKGDVSKFARACGVTHSTIWRSLNEGRVPKLRVLRRIGAGLGYTLGEVLVATGEATADELITRETPLPPPEREASVPELPPRPPRYADPAEQHLWESPTLKARHRLMLIDFLKLIRKHA
ncbi:MULTISPECIES: helix-turn-helix transcriptional regulator [unclassified Nonomuraea]|uniref:helix-turn-helix domain-containing protein n=1 Tax=unclassified Nonomuraea TaxID=2593643 RepID=UPI0033ED6A57